MFTAITAIIVAIITALLGPLILSLIKRKWSNTKLKNKNSIFNKVLDLNQKIDSQLENMSKELECDRIWVIQFHNGGHYFPTGKSIQKFSIFFEHCEPELPFLRQTFQNIPVSFFPKSISKTYKEGELVVHFESESEFFDLDCFYKLYNIKSLYCIAIYDLEDRFIGILNVSYEESEYKFTKEDWVYTRQKIGILGVLLSDLIKKNR
jgi:hypothetical protein